MPVADELVQGDETQFHNLTHPVAQFAVVWIIFSRRSWLEATPHSEGLTEAISCATLSSLKQLLNDVIFICFTYNNLFALAMIKKTT